MKRLMISLLGALAFTAVAQAAQPQAADPSEARKEAEAKKPAHSDSYCLQDTGTRISSRSDKGRQRNCSAIGRSYTRDDLRRTGAIDVADALRKLDPAVH